MRSLVLLALVAAAPVFAEDPPKKPAAKTAPKPTAKPAAKPGDKAAAKKPKPKVDLSFGTFGDLPKADGVTGPQRDSLGTDTMTSASDATYEVVKVAHAKQFMSGQGGAKAVGPLQAVALKGNPPTTEKFSSVIRVKSPQKAGAPIDVVILDARGDTALEASGSISFRGGNSDETEWIVDWDPTSLRGPGEYKVLVRIAGQPMGTWPLVVEAR